MPDDDAFEVAEAHDRLKRYGRTVCDLAVRDGRGDLLWVVSGRNGENLLKLEAWRLAAAEARSSDSTGGQAVGRFLRMKNPRAPPTIRPTGADPIATIVAANSWKLRESPSKFAGEVTRKNVQNDPYASAAAGTTPNKDHLITLSKADMATLRERGSRATLSRHHDRLSTPAACPRSCR